ncbi:hypothetical protein [Tumebacillus permanentifrigoris]|uniref:Uncharacterized protein n=1 Tax=Tumebacillus permanentifrigoris TaxID=378543 RepID=A0A316D4G1_9BACL|nr:hypothetical protein [Tumebacillus permanentifrigoris]PWK07460.1 hypothetical protein C7459_11759 [Tumebacillus permanentifrigoris]
MFIGILATLILIGITIGQYFESRKSGLLRLARDAYEERAVRYEGMVTYLRGTLDGVAEGAKLYLSVLDGVVCLTSTEKRLFALEGAQVFAQETGRLTLRGAGGEVAIATHPERAQMIQRTIE